MAVPRALREFAHIERFGSRIETALIFLVKILVVLSYVIACCDVSCEVASVCCVRSLGHHVSMRSTIP